MNKKICANPICPNFGKLEATETVYYRRDNSGVTKMCKPCAETYRKRRAAAMEKALPSHD